jgi:hypothetical protein
MVAAGAALLVLFALESPLLGALGGPQQILVYCYIVGGLLLAAGGLLPMPRRLRAAVATLASAGPLFVAPPCVDLVGWRGLVAAVIILVLPGALLLRARHTSSTTARAVVVVAVVLTALLYLVPVHGAMPIGVLLQQLSSGDIGAMIAGALPLAPLVLVTCTLAALSSPPSTGGGRVLAVLILLAVSGALVLLGGIQKPSNLSLVHLGVGVLGAGAAAAVGVAHLLDLDSLAG